MGAAVADAAVVGDAAFELPPHAARMGSTSASSSGENIFHRVDRFTGSLLSSSVSWDSCSYTLPTAVRPTAQSTDVRWERVRSAAKLQAWDWVWRRAPAAPATPAQTHIFRPVLLADPDVLIVAASHQQRIVAGAIANRTRAVVDLSNVFVPNQGAEALWAGCVGTILDHLPGQALVGYETGEGLAQAQACGFAALQPLRLWEIGT